MKIVKIARLYLITLFIISIIYLFVSIFFLRNFFVNSITCTQIDLVLRFFFFEYSLFYILDYIVDYLKNTENLLKKVFSFIIGSIFSFLYLSINQLINMSTNIFYIYFSYIIIIALFLTKLLIPTILNIYFFIKLKQIEYNSYENKKKRLEKRHKKKKNKIIKKYDRKKKIVNLKYKILKLFVPFIVIGKVIKYLFTKKKN